MMSMSYDGGMCESQETAMEFLEMLPDNIPDEIKDEDFCEEYQRMMNTVRFAFSRMTPAKPAYQKGKCGSAHDSYTCGGCGAIVSVMGLFPHFCGSCGRRIAWGSPACMTGVHENG